MKFIILALCVALAYAHDMKDMKENRCMCNIMIVDGPEGKNMMMDAFKNEMKIEACDDKHLEMCKKFCMDTEKEKTDGNLSKESKSQKPKTYGDIMCEKLGVDMEKKTLKMMAKVMCMDNSMKEVDTGLTYKEALTCKDKKFVKA